MTPQKRKTLKMSNLSTTDKGFKNFNRHDVFTRDMHNTAWAIKSVVETAEYDNTGSFMGPVFNKVMGLFDGYLYNNLIQDVAAVGCNEQTVNDLTEIVQIIEARIWSEGETQTPIF